MWKLFLIIFINFCGASLKNDILNNILSICDSSQCLIIGDDWLDDSQRLQMISHSMPVSSNFSMVSMVEWNKLKHWTLKRKRVFWTDIGDLIEFSNTASWSQVQTENIHYIGSRNCSQDFLLNYLSGIKLLLNAKLFITCLQSERGLFMEAYSKSLDLSSQIVVQMACDFRHGEYPCDPMDHIWDRRRDLSGLTLRAAFLPYKPYGMFSEAGQISGIFPDIFMELMVIMNFNYSLVTPDGTF